MRHEDLEVCLVVRRERCPGYDRCGGDHRINAQGTFAACGVEQAGGFEDLRFVKRDEIMEKGSHRGDLRCGDGSIDEITPRWHRRDESLTRLRPLDQILAFPTSGHETEDQVGGARQIIGLFTASDPAALPPDKPWLP